MKRLVLFALTLALGPLAACQLLSGVTSLEVVPGDEQPTDRPDGDTDDLDGGDGDGDGGPALPDVSLTLQTESVGGGAALASMLVGGVEICPGGCEEGSSVATTVPQGVEVEIVVTPAPLQDVRFLQPDVCRTTGNSCKVTPGEDGVRLRVQTVASNFAFCTSQKFTGNLGGVAGADAKCTQAAKNAGLPGAYVAWVSSSASDARARGLSLARGFVRVDGLPFTDAVLDASGADLTEGEVFYPLTVDERGNPVTAGELAFTGTLASGLRAPSNCLDWTSSAPAESGLTGAPYNGSVAWTEGGGDAPCNVGRRLYCLRSERNVATAPKAPPATHRVAFVSDGTFTPSAAGLDDADALCASEATAATLTGTFKALLATSTAAAQTRVRTAVNVGGWYRPDDTPLFPDPRVLGAANATPLAAITQKADGTYLANAADVWTGIDRGTHESASAASATCTDWTSDAPAESGLLGEAPAVSPRFLKKTTGGACNVPRRVYCFQD